MFNHLITLFSPYVFQDDFIHRQREALESQPLEGELDVDFSVAKENTLFMEVVGGPNKKGHVYGLGKLGDEFVASYSQSNSQSNNALALDYEAMMAALNAKLAEKDLKIDRINNELAEKDRKIEQFGTELKETKGLIQQLIECVSIPRSSSTSAQPSLDPSPSDDGN
jgi:uncharacterized coiled-coil protein SlyX